MPTPQDSKSRSSDSTSKSPRLGRGLSALMGVAATPVRVEPAIEKPTGSEVAKPKQKASVITPHGSGHPAPSHTTPFATQAAGEHESLSDLQVLPVSDLVPNKFQPRRDAASSDVASLAASIKSAGVMQPVIVRPLPTSASGSRGPKFEIVAGERRWRAAQVAGLTRIPAIVRRITDEQSAEWALIENVQREDLNAMDRAVALKSLCDKFGVSHADLGEKIGLDRSTIANLIRLTELEPEIAELISKGQLGAGHGKALLSAPAGPGRVRLAREASQRSYSVRRLEYEAKRLASGTAEQQGANTGLPSPREAVLRDIEKRIAQSLGTKVYIRTDASGKKGQIMLDFYNLDQFDGILSRLGVAGS